MLCVVDYLKGSTSFNDVVNMPNRYSHMLFAMWRKDIDAKIKANEEKERQVRRAQVRGPGDIRKLDEEERNTKSK